MSNYDLCTIVLTTIAAHTMDLRGIARAARIATKDARELMRDLELEGIIVKCPQTRVYRIAELGEPDWSL